MAINRVRSVLERELERRRVAQAGGVGIEGLGSGDSPDSEDTESGMGGLECSNPQEGFKFANWEGGEIAFLGTSTVPSEKEKEGGLASFQEWIVDVFNSS